MAHLIIGALLTAVFISLFLHARNKHLRIAWWQWLLTILGLLYTGFVLEVIVSFLEEGAEKAALVIGMSNPPMNMAVSSLKNSTHKISRTNTIPIRSNE
jgi:hypothetical protein